MKPRFLVVRSGERVFPSQLVPDLELVERTSHAIETLPADPVSGPFDLAIFTSRPAVDRFLARDDLLSTLPGRVLAVGPATAERFRSALSIDVEEGGGSVRRMLRALPRDLSGARVLLPRGDDAEPDLLRELEARGADVVSMLLYRKIALPYDPELDSWITAARLMAFCPTSPSAAQWLLDGAGEDARMRLRKSIAIVLGDATREALSARHIRRIEIARPPTFDAVARKAAALAAREPPG